MIGGTPMVSQDSLLVTLVKLVGRVPMPALPTKRGRGHPIVYSDRLFLKAVVIMIVRHLHNVHERLSVLAQPTAEMRTLRRLLTQQERFPSRRTWERRLKALPASLPAQIGCLYYSDTFNVNWLQQRIDVTHLLFGDLAYAT